LSDPLAILFVNMHHGWGGQPSVVLTLAKGLAQRGHRCVVGAPEGSELMSRAADAGIDVLPGLAFRRGLHPISIRRDARIIRECVAERGIRIVESNGSQDTWAAALALGARHKREAPVRLVRWRHNSFPVKSHFLNRRLYARLIDHVVVSSEGIKPILVEPGIVEESRVTVLNPSVDPSRFREEFRSPEARAACRAELGLGDDDLVVAAVGRLAEEKGHDVIFAAAKKVAALVPRARFLIIGKGTIEVELRERARETGLAETVVFAGFRKDIPRVLSACDVNALTPVSGESFGIVLLEGFCAGLPAVATDVGGVRSVCRDGETGILCPPGDVDAIADALVKLLSDAELGRQYARNGKRMVEDEFTDERLMENAEALFRRLLASGGDAS